MIHFNSIRLIQLSQKSLIKNNIVLISQDKCVATLVCKLFFLGTIGMIRMAYEDISRDCMVIQISLMLCLRVTHKAPKEMTIQQITTNLKAKDCK